jgi:ATP-dependent RNA helicase DeaD
VEEEQLEAATRLGYGRTPELVEELEAVALRGNPIAAIAARGAGAELLYALAAAGRCDPESPAVQGLVLCPTEEDALRAAEALHAVGLTAGLEALAWRPWREAREGDGGRPERPFAQLVAGRPVELLPEVRSGRLKLGEIRLLALHGVSALEGTGQWESVEAILDTLPEGAQKIAVDDHVSDRLKALVTHQLGRGKKWPAELFAPGGEGAPSGAGVLLAGSASSPEGRLERLSAALRTAAEHGQAESAVVHCPDEATAYRTASGLAARGFALAEEPGDPGVVVAWGDEEGANGTAAVLGLPSGLPELERRLGSASARIAIVADGELPQLRILARRAGWTVKDVPEPPPAPARDSIARLRESIRRRIEGFDDAAELLVLEPLLEEHGAARVAAALGALLRERHGTAEEEAEEIGAAGAGAPAAGHAAGGPREPRGKPRGRTGPSGGEPGTRGSWFRLYINAGSRDGVGPNDIVGAITGETGAVGAQIGQIDIRNSYTLVDVDSQIAEQVMTGLSGASIKGREVVARPDRGS